ncbi:MarR family transcriptional regulator [Microbacterium sp. Leaf179]|uniref:MarR family transcriptional regulator n=1 Tax=Microbacterium sp. Leaf179 TaxID=1736288 RepID=UPI0006F4CB2A|nr:helix-turn-helix domain-containing protein [Microbacterium sp. Leaf179]KQR86973.1 transcriptional regulator [Microbacterium sp. Leaf179]
MQTSSDSSSSPSPGSDLGRALLAYGEARRVAAAAARRELALNELDARALVFVADNPGARPSHVRDHLGITSAGVTTLIDRLVQRGAVRRDLDEDDRRVNHITATVDLDSPPWSALRAFDDGIEAVIAGLDAERAAAAASLLQHLIATVAIAAER